jgi:hypothetical protein
MIECHLLPHKNPPWLDSWLIKAVPKTRPNIGGFRKKPEKPRLRPPFVTKNDLELFILIMHDFMATTTHKYI